jgi:hypothetical protein
MGVCASCLGRQRSESLDDDEVSRLLFEDQNNIQYGSFGEQGMNQHADPLESQREAEALQRVVARTSNNLVDVFEIAPQESQRVHPTVMSGQDARLARYQNILSKLSPEDGVDSVEIGHEVVEWLPSKDDSIELHGNSPGIKEGSGEPFVGTFADAVTSVV